ncbi:hypothetical protein BDQ17DRAFT_1426732 [Cyathus striatus]|nr:hypothetical protein BDQ17DRAFT_1426732 [Cyathus striatus]
MSSGGKGIKLCFPFQTSFRFLYLALDKDYAFLHLPAISQQISTTSLTETQVYAPPIAFVSIVPNVRHIAPWITIPHLTFPTLPVVIHLLLPAQDPHSQRHGQCHQGSAHLPCDREIYAKLVSSRSKKSGWLSFPSCAPSTSTLPLRCSAFFPTTSQSLHPSLAASSLRRARMPSLLLPSTGYTTWECTPRVFAVQVAIPHDNTVVPFVKFDILATIRHQCSTSLGIATTYSSGAM